MFKYLWLVIIAALYLWWLFEAMKGLIDEIRFDIKIHSKFRIDNCPDVTVWFILLHVGAILVWSIMEFILYYS